VKAFLLAAGYGTRLKPITDKIPKCLVPVCNKPLLYHWLDLLERENVSEVLINTHYLPAKVNDAVSTRSNKIKITLTHEPELLGSAGTILKNKDFVKDEEDFFILYSDNLTNVSLKDIYEFHKARNAIFTTYVYYTGIPREKGIFESEKNGKVISFEEKPLNPKSNLANSGIGVLNKKIFKYMEDSSAKDFAKDVMPKIVNNTFIKETVDYIKDIGNVKDYEAAEVEWRRLNNP
jgi:mannose-1-phosphate guanylyltransferase